MERPEPADALATTVGSESSPNTETAIPPRRWRSRPTIEDVARRAGVSKAAVSFAVGGQAGIGEGTRARILAAANELNWLPSIHVKAMLQARAFAVGLVVSRDAELLAADPFYGGFIAGVELVLAERGYVLVLQVVGPDPEVEAASYRRLVAERRVDGVFLIDLRVADPRVALLAELDVPVISVGPPVADSPFPGLDLREEIGVAEAVRHLAALGHTSIGYVGGMPGFLATETRHKAWLDEMTSLGLSVRRVASGGFTGQGGATATRNLLSDVGPPTAIVFANDLMAIAGMSVAREAGMSLPDDLSLVGFDDIAVAVHVTPGLTTLRQDPLTTGRVAARMLLRAIDDDGYQGSVKRDPPVLMRRASTSEPRDR